MVFQKVFLSLALLSSVCGCASTKSTNTARSAMEQLLISNAVDQSLDKVDFAPFAGRKVYLEEKYIDCVDKNYVVSSVRHRMLRAGALLQDKAETAEIGVEIRTGSVGTDQGESFVGTPEITLPGGLMSLPEVRLMTRKNQTATAKIGLVAYDYANKSALGDGGMTLARSDENQYFFLGVGPYRTGTVREEVEDGLTWKPGMKNNPLPQKVAFQSPALKPVEPGNSDELKYASGEKTQTPSNEPGMFPTAGAAGTDVDFSQPVFK